MILDSGMICSSCVWVFTSGVKISLLARVIHVAADIDPSSTTGSAWILSKRRDRWCRALANDPVWPIVHFLLIGEWALLRQYIRFQVSGLVTWTNLSRMCLSARSWWGFLPPNLYLVEGNTRSWSTSCARQHCYQIFLWLAPMHVILTLSFRWQGCLTRNSGWWLSC